MNYLQALILLQQLVNPTHEILAAGYLPPHDFDIANINKIIEAIEFYLTNNSQGISINSPIDQHLAFYLYAQKLPCRYAIERYFAAIANAESRKQTIDNPLKGIITIEQLNALAGADLYNLNIRSFVESGEALRAYDDDLMHSVLMKAPWWNKNLFDKFDELSPVPSDPKPINRP